MIILFKEKLFEMKFKNNDILFITALLFALWFSIIGVVWVYWLNIIFAYPFGIASFFIWKKIKKDGKKRNKIVLIVLILGLIASLSALLLLLLFN